MKLVELPATPEEKSMGIRQWAPSENIYGVMVSPDDGKYPFVVGVLGKTDMLIPFETQAEANAAADKLVSDINRS